MANPFNRPPSPALAQLLDDTAESVSDLLDTVKSLYGAEVARGLHAAVKLSAVNVSLLCLVAEVSNRRSAGPAADAALDAAIEHIGQRAQQAEINMVGFLGEVFCNLDPADPAQHEKCVRFAMLCQQVLARPSRFVEQAISTRGLL
jgi:hypothetical protein